MSLNYPRGAVSLSLTASEGVSEFLPDPGSGSPFLAGTDLVSESNTAVIGIHWRALRNLRIRLDARLEDRTFTTIGNESILSLHPEIEYGIGAWRFSAGYTRYERTNGTTLADDTVLLRISRRFY